MPIYPGFTFDADRILKSRSRVLTDEGSFGDDYHTGNGGSGTFLDRALTGTSLFTAGSVAVVGTGTLYTTEIRAGDYVELDADYSQATPVWAQVLSVTDDTHLTLVNVYTGAGALVAGPSSVCNYWFQFVGFNGTAAVIGVANSLASAYPGRNNNWWATLLRRVGVAGRKGYAPLHFSWYGLLTNRLANQATYLGFIGVNPATSAVIAGIDACFMFDGADNTVVTLRTRSGTNAVDTWDEDVALAGGAMTSANHLYEILLYPDRCIFMIDREQVGTIHDRHLPDPYQELAWWEWIGNSGAVGGDAYVRGDWTVYSNYDDMRVEVIPPSGGGSGVGSAGGYVQSLLAPDPSAIEGSALEPLDLEPDRSLRTRARVLTDEGSFAGNFPNASIYRDLTVGTSITFTTGSLNVTGVGTLFTQEIRVGDYVQYTDDADETAPVQAQVQSIESDTHLTLRTAYTGAGGTSGAGPGVADVCDWLVYCLAGGADGSQITVAGGYVDLHLGLDLTSRAYLARRLGAGSRKGCAPLWTRFMAHIDGHFNNRRFMVGLVSNLGTIVPVTIEQAALFHFTGLDPALYAVNTSYNTVIYNYVQDLVLPNGGSMDEDHLFEIEQFEDQVAFYVDRQLVFGTGQLENQGIIPTPYQEMYLLIQVHNVNAKPGPTGGGDFFISDVHEKSLDVVDARLVQPDADKLQTAARVSGPVQSLQAPNPSAVLGTDVLSGQLEPDHALRTRARVLTDEGSLTSNFPGRLLYRALAGNCTFTAGSTAVLGEAGVSLFTTQIRVGDYVEITAHEAPGVPAWAQVDSIYDDTHLTLRTAYTAGGGPVTGPAQVCDWYVFHTALGAEAIVVAAGGCSITVSNVNGERCLIARRLGAGNRKGHTPLWTRFVLAINNRSGNNQWATFGLTSNLASSAAIMQASLFCYMGDDATEVAAATALDVGAGLFYPQDLTLPREQSGELHLFEIEQLEDQVNFYVDRNLLWTSPGFMPDPYQEMYLFVQLENIGVPAGGATLLLVDAKEKSLDVLDGRMIQPDPDKLQTAATVLGLVQSHQAPNPASVEGTAEDSDVIPAKLEVEPDGALRTRSRTLTDEGIFYDDFPGGSLLRAPGANCTFYHDRRDVLGAPGAAFDYYLKVGDYIFLTAHGFAFAQQVVEIQDGEHLTLGADYLGANATGAASIMNYRETVVDVGVTGSAITVAASEATFTQSGLANLDCLSLARKLGAGGFKPSLPLRLNFAARQDVRRANQTTVFGVFDAVTIATATAGAWFQFEGADANTIVRIDSQSGTGVVSEQSITLPGAAVTSDLHTYEMVIRPDRVSFYYAGILLGTVAAHLLDPYLDLYLFAAIFNTGVTGGVTILRIDHAVLLDVNELEADVFQSDAAKLRASVQDITPICPAASVSMAVDSDLEHVITATTQVGYRYRVSVVGGAGLCIRCDGVAPVVTNEPWWDGQKHEFIATVGANTVRAIKRTAATADGTVIVTSLNGGYIT